MTVTLPPPGQILKWLGGPIEVRVEVDTGLEGATFGLWDSALWDVATWGSRDPAWSDATPFVITVDIAAGATRWGERFESSSAAVLVNNTTGIFTPDSEVPYWHLPFRPGRRIRVVAIPDEADGTKWPLFTGQIDATNDLHDLAGYDLATQILCSDFMAVLAAHNPLMLETPTGVQATDDRVAAALDRLDFPLAYRDLQAGVHTVQTSFLAQTTLEECQRAADAEGGAFYTDRRGYAVFKSRDWLTTDPRSVEVVGYLGYDTVPAGVAGAHIVGIDVTHEAARVVNQVAFARVGSTLQTVEDVDSQALFDIRSYQRTDLENNADEEVAALAARYLAAFATDRARLNRVDIAAVEDPDNDDLNRLMYDTRFGDRIAVLVEAPGWSYEKEVHVMGLNHSITADEWRLSLRLDDAQTFAPPPEPPEPSLPVITNALVARYDADALALADGATLVTWPDIGPNGYTLSDWAGAPHPTYHLAQQNGRAGVRFPSASGLRYVGAVASPRTFFVVAKNPAAPSGGVSSHITYGANTTMSRWTTSGRWIWGRSEFSFIEFTDAALQGAACLWCLKYQATGAVVRANKVQRATGNITAAADTHILLGSPGNNQTPTLTVYEYLIYDGVVNATDTDTIEAYLATKWGTP